MERKYDLVVILDSGLSSEEQDKLLEKIKKIISDLKGGSSEVKKWGKRELAYSIGKKRDGVYAEVSFVLPAQAAPQLKSKLQGEENILRHLLIRKDE